MTTLDPAVFIKAAYILRQTGWRQKASGDVGEPHCVVGALREAKGVTRYDDVIPEVAVLRELLDLSHNYQVLDWNDDFGRTVDEVIGLLEQAAENPAAGS